MCDNLRSLAFAVVLLGSVVNPVRADLRFAEPVAELGRVRSGVPAGHRFAFSNVGLEPVEILAVRAACGCLVPRVAQRVYQLGENGVLAVDVNTLSQPAGPHVWQLQIVYRQGDSTRETTLQLKAEVVREVTVEPAALVVSADRPLQREVLVRDVRPRPLLIQRVTGSSAALTPHVQPPTRDADGRWRCRILLDVTPDSSAGRRDEVLSIYTDDPDYRELRVPVTIHARTARALTATPAEITLTAPAGQPIPSQRLLIRHREERPITIERVETGDPALQVQWAQGEQRVGVVKVSVDRAKFQGGKLATRIQVHVSQPVREVIVVPVTVDMPGSCEEIIRDDDRVKQQKHVVRIDARNTVLDALLRAGVRTSSNGQEALWNGLRFGLLADGEIPTYSLFLPGMMSKRTRATRISSRPVPVQCYCVESLARRVAPESPCPRRC